MDRNFLLIWTVGDGDNIQEIEWLGCQDEMDERVEELQEMYLNELEIVEAIEISVLNDLSEKYKNKRS